MLRSSGKGLASLEQTTQHTLGFESDCLRKYPDCSEPAADLGLELSLLDGPVPPDVGPLLGFLGQLVDRQPTQARLVAPDRLARARMAITPFPNRYTATIVGAQGFLAFLNRYIGLGCSGLKSGGSACGSRLVAV
jgi:hypothetical protein